MRRKEREEKRREKIKENRTREEKRGVEGCTLI